MAKLITNSLMKQLEVRSSVYDVRDSEVKGFMVRVAPSGSMSYAVQYARGKRQYIGKVGILTPKEAREKVKDLKKNTINRMLASLRSVFKLALHYEYIDTLPFKGIKQFKYPDERIRYLSDNEEKNYLTR